MLLIYIFEILFIIKVGSKLPAAELFEDSPANKVNIQDIFANKKGILIGVPGAFTPTCSNVCIARRKIFFEIITIT